ncbi:DUF1329 domain-containing protein [Wenzhouxiangella marina]|uniref:Uncharacterized protein n=1 Tax=Wenzhouxiangella marina TaxID=1579979 RepID=A0A0K0XZ98_9GAMM|nr:DUF1329 domain-containing protein [Wenzhouxiangella marina]AKS42957.1 hypothetical protein WM2015_2599 [Wenzhouxiangella marina]MBB6087359.1 hypothetical protein [Wenzhouxiangella marina]
MKTQSIKQILTLAAIAALSLGLVACGSTPESQPTESDQTQEELNDRFEEARAEREAAEAAERQAAEAERQAAEAERAAEAARREAEAEAARAAAEAEARAEAERQAAEAEAAAAAAAAREEAQRRAAEAEMAAAEAAAREEAERMAAERMAAEAAAAEAAAAEEAERRAAAAAAAAEAEAERMAAEAAAAEAAAREDAERIAAENAAAQEAAAEAAAAQAAARAAAEPAVPADSGDFILARTPENIARLGRDLTPMGSIRGGSADGRIPAWDGGLGREDWPAGYEPGDRHLDPFAADEPLYVITGENYQEYADRLSVGQMATFARYPDTYIMKVYPTRRSASFPEFIYEATIRNASTGRLTAEGEGVADVSEGFPFPLPQNAYELMWNHKLKYKGTGGVRYNNQVAPTTSGSYQLVRLREELLGLYYVEGSTIADTNNILLYFFQEVESPARLAGNILLVHETLNQLEQPRQAWIYNPGQRRVRRAPNVAYDNPGTASDGLRTNDMTDMFNGAMDRFTWEIVGKKEMYIPYNSYQLHSGDLTPDDIVRPGHLNPDLMRYELHRVWIVDARLREGTRHINSRRTFYLDEDSYQIALIDHYDQRGELWRASEAHTINYYDLPTYWSSVETHMDLQSGRYVATGIDNQDPVNTFNVPLSPSSYTPQALRTRGRR